MPQRIDPHKEDVFPLGESPRRLGKTTKRVREYINEGVVVRNLDEHGVETFKETVYLQPIRLPGGIGTSLEAYNRFLEDLDDAHNRAKENGQKK